MKAEDIKTGMEMAADDHHSVMEELKGIAQGTRLRVLNGDDRQEFFKGMTQPEFDFLHKVAMSLGPKGLNALEKLMTEAEGALKGGG